MKLLIGCYSYASNLNYGTDPGMVKQWLAGQVKALDDLRKAKLAELETANAFQAIFVSPEYQFTDPNSTNRKAMDKDTKKQVLDHLRDIGDTYREILMFPGTVFWKEPLDNAPALQKFESQLVAAELKKVIVGRQDVVQSTRTLGGKPVHSLKALSGAVKTAPSGASYRVYNELYPFLGKKQMNGYLKQWDFKETEGASATEQAFVPGSSSGTREIGGFSFGLEICFDHGNGGLKQTNEQVDFHVVVSDHVPTKTANMMMKNGGYFIHASSNPAETGVYVRNGTNKVKLTPTNPPVTSNAMNYWLVDVQQRASAQEELSTMPTTAFVTSSGKVLQGVRLF